MLLIYLKSPLNNLRFGTVSVPLPQSLRLSELADFQAIKTYLILSIAANRSKFSNKKKLCQESLDSGQWKKTAQSLESLFAFFSSAASIC